MLAHDEPGNKHPVSPNYLQKICFKRSRPMAAAMLPPKLVATASTLQTRTCGTVLPGKRCPWCRPIRDWRIGWTPGRALAGATRNAARPAGAVLHRTCSSGYRSSPSEQADTGSSRWGDTVANGWSRTTELSLLPLEPLQGFPEKAGFEPAFIDYSSIALPLSHIPEC